jgi:predicted permease
MPFITFHGMYTTELTRQALSLPLFFFILCSLMALGFLGVGKLFFKDNTANLLGFAASYGNYSYFAIPAGIILFGKESENIIILSGIGFIVFSGTVGYFLTALGNFSLKTSLIKTLKLPSLYTSILGLVFNALGWRPGMIGSIDAKHIYDGLATDLRGCLSVLGMMLLGLAIAEIKHFKFEIKFVSLSFLAQFVVWPLIIGSIIFVDKQYLHFYSTIYYQSLFLLSLIPIGINLIAYATQLNVQPEKAAFTILLSTVFAMFYIPFMIMVFAGLL